MTRRLDALIPLTHDHHHALHRARLLRSAARGSGEERVAAVRDFCEFFHGESVRHFREEEEEILPVVALREDAPSEEIARVLSDHVRMHALVGRVEAGAVRGHVEGDDMVELADTLAGHVRFEEEQLFPAIERIAADALARVVLAPRGRTRGASA